MEKEMIGDYELVKMNEKLAVLVEGQKLTKERLRNLGKVLIASLDEQQTESLMIMEGLDKK
jgi:hypothetical protein